MQENAYSLYLYGTEVNKSPGFESVGTYTFTTWRSIDKEEEGHSQAAGDHVQGVRRGREGEWEVGL